MNCSKCNTPYKIESDFCDECGHRLIPAHLQTEIEPPKQVVDNNKTYYELWWDDMDLDFFVGKYFTKEQKQNMLEDQ